MFHRYLLFVALLAAPLCAQEPVASVTHAGGAWTIAGKLNQVTLDEKDLSVAVHAGPVTWKMLPSSDQDLLVNAGGETIRLRLADAKEIHIEPYHTGFSSGVRMIFNGFAIPAKAIPGATWTSGSSSP